MAISEERAKCERENTVLRVRISDLQAEVEDHAASLLATVIRAEAAEAEVKRLHDLHLERTHLTTRMIKERDAAEAKLAAIEAGYREAIEDIEQWAAYASGYFQAKHDLAGCLAKHKAILDPEAT